VLLLTNVVATMLEKLLLHTNYMQLPYKKLKIHKKLTISITAIILTAPLP